MEAGRNVFRSARGHTGAATDMSIQWGAMRALDVRRPIRSGRLTFLGVLGALVVGLVWNLVVPASGAAAWLTESSPSPGTESTLNGVSCVSASSCEAVGYFGNNTLVESWNGSAWSIVRSPDRGTNSTLDGVSCVSAGSCKAVGNYSSSTGLGRTLVESWNGYAWSIVRSPDRGTNSTLDGVSCVSASSCKAVGNYTRIHRKTSVARRYGAERARVSRSSPQGLRMCSSAPQRAHRTRTHLEVEVDGGLLAPGEVGGRRPLLEAQARSTVVSGPIARRFSRQVLNWSSHGHSTGR